jgi:lysophospholipase L1-like esterase
MRCSSKASRTLAGIAVSLFVIALGASPAPVAGRREPVDGTNPPSARYLSLGDSFAYGYQAQRFQNQLATGVLDPTAFPGYTAPVGNALGARAGELEVDNLGCPGESTASFLAACPFPSVWMHTPYTGSQLSAARRVIRSDPRPVSAITISLGGNDLYDAQQRCAGDATCLRKALNHVRSNLVTIVRSLRRAAPQVPIVVLQPFNVVAVDDPGSDIDAIALNQVIAQAAAAGGAGVADAFTLFNRAPNEPGALCRLTLWCHDHDSHPSDAGYRLLARLFVHAIRAS